METYDFSRSTHYTVSIFVIDKRKILLLKQSRSSYWLLPSGHIDDNELPHEAASREVLEETGLKIELLQKPDKKAKTKIVTPLPVPYDMRLLPCRNKRDLDMVFTARVIGGKLKISKESLDGKWFSKKELLTNPAIGPYVKHFALKLVEEEC